MLPLKDIALVKDAAEMCHPGAVTRSRILWSSASLWAFGCGPPRPYLLLLCPFETGEGEGHPLKACVMVCEVYNVCIPLQHFLSLYSALELLPGGRKGEAAQPLGP